MFIYGTNISGEDRACVLAVRSGYCPHWRGPAAIPAVSLATPPRSPSCGRGKGRPGRPSSLALPRPKKQWRYWWALPSVPVRPRGAGRRLREGSSRAEPSRQGWRPLPVRPCRRALHHRRPRTRRCAPAATTREPRRQTVRLPPPRPVLLGAALESERAATRQTPPGQPRRPRGQPGEPAATAQAGYPGAWVRAQPDHEGEPPDRTRPRRQGRLAQQPVGRARSGRVTRANAKLRRARLVTAARSSAPSGHKRDRNYPRSRATPTQR